MIDVKVVNNLNQSIKKHFKKIKTIEKDYKMTFSGISRLVMLDRYAQKDKELKTLCVGDIVITIIKEDKLFPLRGIGNVVKINKNNNTVEIKLEEEYVTNLDDNVFENKEKLIILKNISEIEKPLEIFYEQIAWRVSNAMSEIEEGEKKIKYQKEFFSELLNLNIVPAGRVLYGAGSDSDVTLFNCFVLPMIKDSREGISKHREEAMEIMSRGGGVGTNGSTLRPRNTIAKGVGGKSSGAVSWLNDLSTLTNLVEQGGSRRGAQMIMLGDWHPDIIEFIISKMQNIKILKYISEHMSDPLIQKEAHKKMKFKANTDSEQEIYDEILKNDNLFNDSVINRIKEKQNNGGEWIVENHNFLSGANISVAISDKFMKAVKENDIWELKFPDIANLSIEDKKFYDENWQAIGDVEEWERLGYKTKVYHRIKAKELWDLINFCANYSAEPGVFFIDRANEMTNAKSYNMKVVSTNPCGEQPLAPYSVCNLAAINLANFVNKKTGEILFSKLQKTVKTCVRFQDNVIDVTPYFLKKNEIQAKGERRIGLGVMGLHDMLIWAGYRYGSPKANKVVDKIFKIIAESAYIASSDLAVEKGGSFAFLEKNEDFLKTGYMKKMSPSIKNLIRKQGIRNSHLLTVAPTGSTGTMIGVSTGLEPYFAFKFFRSGRLGKFIEVNAKVVEEWLEYHPEFKNKKMPGIFISVQELKPEEHVNVQCIIQRWVDSSISKTVNAPKGFTVKQVEKIYQTLYENGAKGGTVYVDGSRDSQVLSLDSEYDKNEIKEQLNLGDYGIESTKSIKETEEILKENDIKKVAELRGIRQDRSVGIKIGDLCPICREGTVLFRGGCATCNNCNAQLKCDV
ncbi:vitamin B12-dependent ribonucleotide reductase [Spiroplasma endosymbiont of Amphibalanus improvisus]|uniref:vitamin B12-dependent ribonucleotide reductase n=1 Tax=Spiroplasma endosymbiont of Amphibalanus improvisus TaxID=3066327 RepID=UPI00313DCCCD